MKTAALDLSYTLHLHTGKSQNMKYATYTLDIIFFFLIRGTQKQKKPTRPKTKTPQPNQNKQTNRTKKPNKQNHPPKKNPKSKKQQQQKTHKKQKPGKVILHLYSKAFHF